MLIERQKKPSIIMITINILAFLNIIDLCQKSNHGGRGTVPSIPEQQNHITHLLLICFFTRNFEASLNYFYEKDM